MNKLDILYTPLITPEPPKVDMSAFTDWVLSYGLGQVVEGRDTNVGQRREEADARAAVARNSYGSIVAPDASKRPEVADRYPWNIIHAKSKKKFTFDFDKLFPELADFCSSAYGLTDNEITDIVVLNTKSTFTGVGFWHSDIDTTGLRFYLVNNEEGKDFLFFRETIEPYNERPPFGINIEKSPIQLDDKIQTAKLLKRNQSYYLNNIRAVHATNTTVPGVSRITFLMFPVNKIEVIQKVEDLVIRSAKQYKDYALLWGQGRNTESVVEIVPKKGRSLFDLANVQKKI